MCKIEEQSNTSGQEEVVLPPQDHTVIKSHGSAGIGGQIPLFNISFFQLSRVRISNGLQPKKPAKSICPVDESWKLSWRRNGRDASLQTSDMSHTHAKNIHTKQLLPIL